MWTVFKVFIESVTILLLFHILVFWPQGVWDLSSSTREAKLSKPVPPALEGEVLTTGPPGKSCIKTFWRRILGQQNFWKVPLHYDFLTLKPHSIIDRFSKRTLNKNPSCHTTEAAQWLKAWTLEPACLSLNLVSSHVLVISASCVTSEPLFICKMGRRRRLTSLGWILALYPSSAIY